MRMIASFFATCDYRFGAPAGRRGTKRLPVKICTGSSF
jgi:hypothetical protein